MRPQLTWLAVAAVTATPSRCGPAAAAPTVHPAALAAVTCAHDNGTDLDADGRLEVAVGVPGEDRGYVAGDGAVETRHPCSRRSAQFLALPRPHAHDGFGAALAVGTLGAGPVPGSVRPLRRPATSPTGPRPYDPDGQPLTLGTPYSELQPVAPVTGAPFGAVLARNGLHTVQLGAPDAGGGRLSIFVASPARSPADARGHLG